VFFFSFVFPQAVTPLAGSDDSLAAKEHLKPRIANAVESNIDVRSTSHLSPLHKPETKESIHLKFSTKERTMLILDAYEVATHFMKDFDGSHDIQHVDRVHKLAIDIANAEVYAKKIGEDELTIIQLAAILHDVRDWKYKISKFSLRDWTAQWQKPGLHDILNFIIETMVSKLFLASLKNNKSIRCV
jgi:hypothetical protein